MTYKTHPEPSHIQVGFVQLNGTSNSTIRTIIQRSLETIPRITDAGYTGYGFIGSGFSGIFIQPNGTSEDFNYAFAPFYELATMTGISGQVGSITLPRWIDYCNAFLTDPNIATNVIDGTRLLTSEVLKRKSKELTDLILENGASAGFNFIGKVNSAERDNTAVHTIWKESRAILSFGADWADDTPSNEKQRRKLELVEATKKLAEISGPRGGTYMNEANP